MSGLYIAGIESTRYKTDILQLYYQSCVIDSVAGIFAIAIRSDDAQLKPNSIKLSSSLAAR